jgi:hypothetical protein
MRAEGVEEEMIWNKDKGQVTAMFYQTLNNLQGLTSSTDGAEVNNLLSLAKFAVQQAQQSGVYEQLRANCTPVQLNWLEQISKL